jgi:Uma2 family endonuclease
VTPCRGGARNVRRAELRHFFEAEQIMGMPALSKRHWTAADVRALIQEDRPWPRYELLDGELLVTPSPASPHQRVVSQMLHVLRGYCNHHRVGDALVSPADIALQPESIMQPDVFVVPEELLPTNGTFTWSMVTSLLLAVEVVSPSSVRQDRVLKRDFYLANGVREYWIIDIEGRIIERWTPEQTRPEVFRDEITWRPEGATEPLRIDLDDFFHNGCRLPRYI